MLREFKEFAMKGNVLDMAIGIILGAAFGLIVGSLVSDVLMPPIGLVLGRVVFANMFVNLTPDKYTGVSLADARKAGAAVIAYGQFINTVVNFLIVAFVIFLIVRQVNRLKKPAAVPAAPATKDCPYCTSTIAAKAVRCPQCTSDLRTA